MSQKTPIITRAHYGLDAPTLVHKFLLAGGALVIVGPGMLIWGFNLQGTAGNYVTSIATALLISGGKVALMDVEHVKEYGEDLQLAGMRDVHASGLSFWIYPPVRIATARKA